MTQPPLVLTRERPDGPVQGWPTVHLPLMATTLAQAACPQRQPLPHLPVDALFAVSATAVRGAQALLGSETLAALAPRFWAPGPATAQAWADAGIPRERIDQPAADAAQFDSEHLWLQVADQVRSGVKLRVLRGISWPGDDLGMLCQNEEAWQQGHGREWLLQRCIERGAEVLHSVTYVRHRPRWTSADHATAQTLPDGSVWWISSSESVGHLPHLWPGGEPAWRTRAPAMVAVVTHPRMVSAAQAAGFGRVLISRPDEDSVLHTLKSDPMTTAPIATTP